MKKLCWKKEFLPMTFVKSLCLGLKNHMVLEEPQYVLLLVTRNHSEVVNISRVMWSVSHVDPCGNHDIHGKKMAQHLRSSTLTLFRKSWMFLWESGNFFPDFGCRWCCGVIPQKTWWLTSWPQRLHDSTTILSVVGDHLALFKSSGMKCLDVPGS